MTKVLGASATPIVYDLKSIKKDDVPSSKTFFPSIWHGVKKSTPASRVYLSMEQMATLKQFIYGLKESSNEVNDTNKGARVPPQFTVDIDPSTMWDDEKEAVE